MSQTNYHRWIRITVIIMLMGIGLSVYLPAGAQDATEEAATEAPATTEAPPTEAPPTEPPPTEAAVTEAPPVEEPTQEITIESPTVEPTAEVIPTEEGTPAVEPTDESTAEPTTEATTEATAEVTAEATAETTAEATAEVTVEATEAVLATFVPQGDYAVGEKVNKEGWLSIIHGDPSTLDGGHEHVYFFIDDQSNWVRLLLDEEAAASLENKRIQISGQVVGQLGGQVDGVSGYQSPATPVLAVESIRETEAPEGISGLMPASLPLTGQQDFLTIMCRFNGGAAPPFWADPAYFEGLLDNNYPGIADFWDEQSYGNISINASSNVYGWYTLPGSKSFYVPDGNLINFNQSLNDCIARFLQANPGYNFNPIEGINLIFSDDIGCCAWGGGGVFTIGGVTKFFGVTWMPDWAYANQFVLGHEMGHSFQLRHTGLNVNNQYASAWDTMSGGPPGGIFCSNPDPFYGCVGVGIIAFHRDFLEWIPDDRRYVGGPGTDQTIVLERTEQPSPTNYLIAIVPIKTSGSDPIAGSTNQYYTVEARRRTGYAGNAYDANLAGNAVIIHKVNMNQPANLNYPHAFIVDVDNNGDTTDAATQWVPGESFIDLANGIKIEVLTAGATSFDVRIVNLGTAVKAPAKPKLLLPANNAFTNNPAPEFTWEAVPDVTGYTFELARDSRFTDIVQRVPDLTVTNYTLNPVFLEDGSADARYYWRVIAENAFDQTGISASRYFTFDTIEPAVPVQDVTTCNVTFTTLIPTLKWGASDGASKYQVQLYVDGNPIETVTNPSIPGRSYKPPVPLLATTYRWTVQAIDAAGNISGFATPDCLITIQSPANATPILFVYADDTPAITWGDITWDNGYEIQISNSRTFRASTTVFLYTSGELPANTTSYVANHLWDGVWYARVRAKRADGKWGGWSPVTTFVVDIP